MKHSRGTFERHVIYTSGDLQDHLIPVSNLSQEYTRLVNASGLQELNIKISREFQRFRSCRSRGRRAVLKQDRKSGMTRAEFWPRHPTFFFLPCTRGKGASEDQTVRVALSEAEGSLPSDVTAA